MKKWNHICLTTYIFAVCCLFNHCYICHVKCHVLHKNLTNNMYIFYKEVSRNQFCRCMAVIFVWELNAIMCMWQTPWLGHPIAQLREQKRQSYLDMLFNTGLPCKSHTELLDTAQDTFRVGSVNMEILLTSNTSTYLTHDTNFPWYKTLHL